MCHRGPFIYVRTVKRSTPPFLKRPSHLGRSNIPPRFDQRFLFWRAPIVSDSFFYVFVKYLGTAPVLTLFIYSTQCPRVPVRAAWMQRSRGARLKNSCIVSVIVIPIIVIKNNNCSETYATHWRTDFFIICREIQFVFNI